MTIPTDLVCYHEVGDSYPQNELKALPGVPAYAGRKLASTFPGNVIVLPSKIEPHLEWILGHYESIGLQCATEIVFGDYQTLALYPEREVEFFFFGERAHAVRPNQRRRRATENLNSKNNFITTCHNLGVKTPKTVCFWGIQDYKSRPFVLPQGQVYVKKAVSASGKGVYKCKDIHAMNSVISGLDVPFQIQESLPEGTEFLNVQYEVVKGKLLRGTITNQILDGNTHVGNYFPTRFDSEQIYQVTDVLATWSQTIGLEGVFAFDVAITPDGEILPIECNPRQNGASYYSRVADRFGVEAWESRNIDFPRLSFDGFALGELGFSPKRNEGIIIVNWGCVSEGMIGVFVAGSSQVRQDYLAELNHRCRS